MSRTLAQAWTWANPIRCSDQADAFLQSLVRSDPRPYAQRIPQQAVARLLARLGQPQQGLRIVHIAGSKGKGSTALMLEAILQAAGWRTGLFTSPHLQRWSERFRINGQEIDEERYVATLEQLRLPIQALHDENPEQAPAFFDAATATALLLFRQANVDCAILEAGIGGRLDATTIVQPTVTCITSIELEHTDKLGHTIAAIAKEKAGIIKPGVPVIIGRLAPAATDEIVARAQVLTAPLRRLGTELEVAMRPLDDIGMDLSIRIQNHTLQAPLPLVAVSHQADNAALAAACAQELLAATEWNKVVSRGLSQVCLPGRCEILRRQPWVLVDTAHTRASTQALAMTLQALPPHPIHLLLSLSIGKDPGVVCAPLLSLAATVTVTQADPERSLSADAVATSLHQQCPELVVHSVPEPIRAVQYAYSIVPPSGLLCITGSVYMAGLGRSVLA